MSIQAKKLAAPILLATVLGSLGWASASLFDFSLLGHLFLAIGAAFFGICRLIQPIVFRAWRNVQIRFELFATAPQPPKFRAVIVYILLALIFISLVCLVATSVAHKILLSWTLLSIASLLGYLGWHSRRRAPKWVMFSFASYLVSLSTTLLSGVENSKTLSYEVARDLRSLVTSTNNLEIGQERILDSQRDADSRILANLDEVLERLSKQRAESDASQALLSLDTPDLMPVREVLTEQKLREYDRLKAEASLGQRYLIALQTNNDAEVKELQPQVNDQENQIRRQLFETKRAEGFYYFYRRQFSDSANAFSQALGLDSSDIYTRSGFGASVANAANSHNASTFSLEQHLKELGHLTKEFPEDRAVQSYLAMTLANFGNREDIGAARKEATLTELRQIIRSNPNDKALAYWLAVALANSIGSKLSDFVDHNPLLDELRALATPHLGEPKWRGTLAIGLGNAISIADEVAVQDPWLNELRELYYKDPADVAVRRVYANGLALAVDGRPFNPSRVESYLTQLRTLQNDCPNDPELRNSLIIAFSLALNHDDMSVDAAEQILAELLYFLQTNPHNESVYSMVAVGIANRIRVQSSAYLMEQIRYASHRWPDNRDIRKCLVAALYNTFISSEIESEQARLILEEFATLETTYLDDAMIRNYFSKCLFNSSTNYVRTGSPLNPALKKLLELVNAHPNEIEPARMLAKALYNVIFYSPVDYQRLSEHYTELQLLALRFDANPDIVENYMGALIIAFNRAKPNSEDEKKLLNEIKVLAAEHKDKIGVQCWMAKTIGSTILRNELNHERQDMSLEELRQLAILNPSESCYQEALSMGLVNALAAMRNECLRSNALVDELSQHYYAHTDNAAIREHFAQGIANSLLHDDTPHSSIIGLIEQLESLSSSYPLDLEVQLQYAKGLNFAIKKTNLMLDEYYFRRLVDLRVIHSNEAAIQAIVAEATVNSIVHARMRKDVLLCARNSEELLNCFDALLSNANLLETAIRELEAAIQLSSAQGHSEAGQLLKWVHNNIAHSGYHPN